MFHTESTLQGSLSRSASCLKQDILKPVQCSRFRLDCYHYKVLGPPGKREKNCIVRLSVSVSRNAYTASACFTARLVVRSTGSYTFFTVLVFVILPQTARPYCRLAFLTILREIHKSVCRYPAIVTRSAVKRAKTFSVFEVAPTHPLSTCIGKGQRVRVPAR